jgi:proline iminopeptidase
MMLMAECMQPRSFFAVEPKAMPRTLYSVDLSRKMETLLPVGKPLANGERHTLYIAELGNADGYPAVFFHGGPGEGCNDKKAGNFDPAIYRIILVDQRGAGKSTPTASLEANTTADLLHDMETVRKFLQIDKWVIVGTSWGTTLALLYAEKYPQHVTSLVLRGTFLARADASPYLTNNSSAAYAAPEAWQQFKNESISLAKSAGLTLNANASAKEYIATYVSLLNHPDLQTQAAITWLAWANRNLGFPGELPPLAPTITDIAKLVLELTYEKDNFYIEENQIIKNVAPIIEADIPIYLIHGSQDKICPPAQADALQAALPKQIVSRVNVQAGHLNTPATQAAVVNATDAIARELAAKPVVTLLRR